MSGMHEAVTHARAGSQVLVLGQTWDDARDMQLEAVNIGAGDITRVTRSRGQEAIRFRGGGSIWFLSHRSSMRGYSADVVYLPDWRMITDDEFMRELLPVFAGRGHERIGVLA